MICQWFVNQWQSEDPKEIAMSCGSSVDPPRLSVLSFHGVSAGCRSTTSSFVSRRNWATSARPRAGEEWSKVVCACRLFNNVQYISRFFISCQFIEFMSCCQGDLWHILTLPCTSHGSRCTYAGTGFRNIGSPAFGMKRKPFLGRKLTKKISFNIILFFE